MRASCDEIVGKGLVRRDEIYPLIASLIRAERTHRQVRSISYRISGAKFPVLKDMDKFVLPNMSLYGDNFDCFWERTIGHAGRCLTEAEGRYLL